MFYNLKLNKYIKVHKDLLSLKSNKNPLEYLYRAYNKRDYINYLK